MGKPYDFFISYTGKDKAWAEWIAWTLEDAGYKTLIQAWDFRAASNFVSKMQDGAIESVRTIAILSPDYFKSAFTQPEWYVAFASDPKSEQGKLIPVRVVDFEPPGYFSTIAYIDLVGAEERPAQERLVKAIGSIVNGTRLKPATPPAFPGSARPGTATTHPAFPGTGVQRKPLHNRPFSPNPSFAESERLLNKHREAVHQAMAAHNAARSQVTQAEDHPSTFKPTPLPGPLPESGASMPAAFKYDVFLSHNKADKPRVRSLAERLRAADLRVWFDDWIIKPGDDIYLAVEHGLETSRVQVLCLSPEALRSEWVALERSTVLFRDPANAGRRFIPLLLAECQLPDTLRRYKYVDFQTHTESAFAELLLACQAPEGSEDSPPKTPGKVTPLHTAPAMAGKRRKRPTSPRPNPKHGAPMRPALPEGTEPLAVLEQELVGHKHWVRSIAVGPDGKWAASCSLDRTTKIWDLDSGNCRTTLRGHAKPVNSVAITPKGQWVITGSDDHSVRVWEASSGRELAMLAGHTNRVTSVAALPDNVHALSGGFDNSLRLWDIVSHSCRVIMRSGMEDTDSIFCVAVNKAGKLALTGHRDGRILLWSLERMECIATLVGHIGAVHSITFLPDLRHALSGSSDRTMRIWDLQSCDCVGGLEAHTSKVHSVAVSPFGEMLASTGFLDGTVRLWDWNKGIPMPAAILRGFHTPPNFVTFDPTGARLLVGTCEGELHVYRFTGTRRASAQEPARRYVNAKVVLIGEGTVGKTSLAHRLIEDQYVVRDRTHGMNVWRLDLPMAADATLEREALLWDLAGQEDYRLIHQLFLEQTALALLLVNPQKDDPFADAGDWLKALKTSAASPERKRDAARLLVFSQIDAGGMKLGNAKIDRFRDQHGFAGWLPTSAKTGENCSDKENGGKPSKLKQLIAANIPWAALPWTSTPRLLAELKNAVMAMRDKTDIRLLRFAELSQRLEQALPGEKFGEADVRTAVTLLSNHGLARALKFGDLVLLRPDLLNGYAAAIIRAARAHKDEIGCVPEAAIYEPGFDFTGVERLKHRPDEELLLRAIVGTFLDKSLCIAEETPHGRHLVFPSQYRRDKEIPKDPAVFVSYTFSGEWQTVWTTLVVRLWYSQEFAHRELWRNAAEFASNKNHALGLKIAPKHGDGEATISLYFDPEVPDELRVIFIKYVHQHLDRHACDVKRDRRYVCTGCRRPFPDLQVIRELLDEGQKTIVCQKCRTEVELIDFIEQRLKSDPVAQRVMGMDAAATRTLDTQALEQALTGHMMTVCADANQIFRPVTMFDQGIDGELEFKEDDGRASGKKIYVQLKSGDSHLRLRKSTKELVFDVQNERHIQYWQTQPCDVWLVIRDSSRFGDDSPLIPGASSGGAEAIRWMNLTRYLKTRKDKTSRQIVFRGVKLDPTAVWNLRDEFFPQKYVTAGRARP